VSPLQPDLDTIRRSVALFLKPGSVAELRAPKSSQGVISGYFSDPEALVKAAASVSGRAPGVYATINKVHPDALKKNTPNQARANAIETTADREITHRCWLLFDFDPNRATGTSSTDAEHDEALKVAAEVGNAIIGEGWPEPIYADSGNGGHLLYPLDLPNTDYTRDLIKAVLKALAKRYETTSITIDKTVFNASRISKIYGTAACKGQHTEERPHRLSSLIHVPSDLKPVTQDLLEALAAEVKPEPAPPAPERYSNAPSNFRLEDFMSRYGIRVHRGPIPYDGGEKWQLKNCPFNPEHKAPDSMIFRAPSGRLGFRCLHNSCADYNWTSLRDLFEPERPKAKVTSITNGHAADHPPAEPEPEEDPDSHLLALCDEIIASKQSHRIYEKSLFDLIGKADKYVGIQVRSMLRKEFGTDMVMTGTGSWPELYRDAIKTAPWRKRTPELEDNPSPGSLLPVQITDRQLRDISLDAIRQVKAKNDPPSLFVRSGALVHVIQDEKERPSVSVVTESRLRGVLARVANFMKTDRNGEQRNAFPPVEVVKDIMAFNPQSWPFPRLISVAEVPTLRPDGTILDQPGYDEDSAIFYAPASTLKPFPLPESPTFDDVESAKCLVEEAIGEFPYADLASHANTYGLLLTPILRPAFSGCAPLAVVDAPQAGTGKSLLIDVLSIITTGRPAAMMPYPYKEEEMQKQIGASLSAGRQLIVFDNLEGELRSPALALAITAKEFEARILGVSQNMTVENSSTWVVTGNNIRPAGDMPRRCYQIRLNAQRSKPYMDRQFKHPRLLNWVTENRSQILHALLVIARAWFADGRKETVQKTLGSFEEWHQIVGSVIEHAKMPEFLKNYSDFIDQEDESPRQWEEFLLQIFTIWGAANAEKTNEFTIADLIIAINTDKTELRTVLPAEVADCLEKKISHRIVIGKMFRTRRQRHFGIGARECWLDRADDGTEHKGSAKWVVCRSLKGAQATVETNPQIESKPPDEDLEDRMTLWS
jgi:hypothetical protein